MASSTFIASAPQPFVAIPAKQVFQLADLLPEDLAQAFTAGGGHRCVVVTVVAFEWSDGRARRNAEMLPDPLQAALGAEAQLLVPEHKHLPPAEETPEPPELGAVEAAVDVGENPVLERQGFAAAGFLLFQCKGEGQRIISPPVLHCPVVGPLDRIAQDHNQAHRRVVAPDPLRCRIQ